jgi:IS30 family transposase
LIAGGSFALKASLSAKEISRGRVPSNPLRAIAHQRRRAPSTISREVRRNAGQSAIVRLIQTAWNRALRPKDMQAGLSPDVGPRSISKATRKWSPGRLRSNVSVPGEAAHKQVSHETIYRSLYIQARGVLKRSCWHILARKTHSQAFPARQPKAQRKWPD